MGKRACTSRANWRLRTGKPAESISAHYRLDCDYGTAVIEYWEKGGIEPIYVCENHAKQLGPSRDHGPDARVITAESEHKEEPIKREDQSQTETQTQTSTPTSTPAQTQGLAGTKSKGPDSTEAANSLAGTKAKRAEPEVSAKSRVRDVTFGNAAKAMVDEAIWNLATGDYEVYQTALQQGKSARESAQAAGGQLAAVHQKISDYRHKLEAVLSESKATIHVGETIDKPLEQAMLEIIASSAMSESEKDAAIQQLGTVQEWVKRGLQENMTPLQANQILLAIGERLNWGGSTDIPEECKPVYRALFGNLKNAIRVAVPEAQNLHDRLINLYAAKSEADRELLSANRLDAGVSLAARL